MQKNIEEKFACNSENWMHSANDERVKDFCKLSQGN